MLKKVYFLMFVIVVACSCKELKKEVNTHETAKNEVVEWLSFKGEDSVQKEKNIVLISGDEEYRSEEMLPQFAKILSQKHGFNCTVLFAQDIAQPGFVNPNYSFNIPGLEHLQQADLVILFTRFRALPTEQMQFFEAYLKEGKPIIGIRTATHAFNFENKEHPYVHYGWNYRGENQDWQLGFGKKVLGETWYTHHGNHKHQSTRGIINNELQSHPILTGIKNGAIWGPTDVYGIRTPISVDTQVLVYGKSVERKREFNEKDRFYGMQESDTVAATLAGAEGKTYNPNENMPPIVWLKSYQLENGKKGKALTSTIGAATDFLDLEVRLLLVNASYYLLDEKIVQTPDVGLIGDYNPSQFGFHDDGYWKEKSLKVQDFR
ncbi:ThuA domain-containing protein [Croceivirga lutea]|uniref:ThuA domain-containing protein n=1 Tax=Croceivirga lutea TaxID=1775167 RepID=UPI001E5050CE|nr:ThuA domain-containing protein [Croceivirga lutea]